MIRRNQAFFNRVNIVLDMLLVVSAYAASAWIWIDLVGGYNENMAALSGLSVFLSLVYSVLVYIILSVLGFYVTNRTRRLSWKLRTIFLGVTLAVLLASTVLFILKLIDFSRGVLYLFYLLTLLLLMGKYTVMRVFLSRLREKGYNQKHVLVIGTGRLAEQFIRDVEAEKGLGFEIVGCLGRAAEKELFPTEGRAEQSPQPPVCLSGKPYLGDYTAVEPHLENPDVQEAVIALDPEEYDRIPEMIASCEKYGVKYYIIPFYNDVIPAHPVIETVGRSKLIDMRANRLEGMGWGTLKRGFDVIVSALGLVILSPLMLAIAAGVKLSSPGPVLFRQTRVGYMRKEFQMLKFRSMRINSEANTAWTKNEDLRRTRFGSLIRKLSLDELPQLINVLKGDMSLIGPRPELPYFVDQFKETVPLYMVKHQVKPGMTGWAQVNGYRGDTSITRRIELDLWYIDNWSIWLDLQILFRTFFGGMVNREKRKA